MEALRTRKRIMVPQQYSIRTYRFYPEAFSRTDKFLSIREQENYRKLRFAKRRREWLLGRLAAKELVRESRLFSDRDKPQWANIEISNETGGRPFVSFVQEDCSKKLDASLSISHCREIALCSFVVAENVSLGVDIERVETRPKLFAETFYSKEELDFLKPLENRYDQALTLMWTVKEAVLKALGTGLREDTKKVMVTLPDFPWKPWKPVIVQTSVEHCGETYAWVRCMGRYAFAWVVIENFHCKNEDCG